MLTTKALARQIGIAESTYRAWEGGRAIQGEPYAALANALGVSVHELVSGEKPDLAGAADLLEQIERDLGRLKSVLNRLR